MQTGHMNGVLTVLRGTTCDRVRPKVAIVKKLKKIQNTPNARDSGRDVRKEVFLNLF